MKIPVFLCLLCLITSSIEGQDLVWAKDHPGKLTLAFPASGKNETLKKIFEILNSTPFISDPKGVDIIDILEMEERGNLQKGRMVIRIFPYFKEENASPRKKSVFYSINIYINDAASLRDQQRVIFPEEAAQLQLPEMFRDTFPVEYKMVNGYPLGHAISTTYNSEGRIFLLNPGKAVFVPLTQEQYIRFWIGKLQLDIQKDSKHAEETKENLKTMATMPDLKETLAEVQKIYDVSLKWIDFLKARKQHYEQLLATLGITERRAPAYYSIPEQVAVMQDRNGRYVEKINGGLPYQLYEGEPTLIKGPVHTFNPQFFNPKLPSSAIQLLVIHDVFAVTDKHALKDRLDQDFYYRISYKNIASLMRY